jgi:hypothetical protein
MGVYLHSSQFMNKQCGYSSLVHLSTTNCPLPYASSPLGTSKGEVSRSNHQATPLLQDMWLDINTNHSESGYLVPKSVYNICMQIFASIYSGEMAWYIWSKLYKYVKWPSCMHLSWHLQTELSKKVCAKKRHRSTHLVHGMVVPCSFELNARWSDPIIWHLRSR